MLAPAGYFTAMAGKWHLDKEPTDFGFQRYFGHLSGATNYYKGDKTFRLNGAPWTVPAQGFYNTVANVDHALRFLGEARETRKPWFLYVAFNAPLLTRRERAERLRRASPDFWDRYPPQAREVLSAILDQYAEHGEGEIALPDVLDVPPISEFGNIIEVAGRFGGTEQLRDAVGALHRRLYDVAQAG